MVVLLAMPYIPPLGGHRSHAHPRVEIGQESVACPRSASQRLGLENPNTTYTIVAPVEIDDAPVYVGLSTPCSFQTMADRLALSRSYAGYRAKLVSLASYTLMCALH